MELVLTRQEGSQVAVTCDGQHSHSFDLMTLVPDTQTLPSPLDDPIAYGKRLFEALFPADTLAQRTLETMPERILLVSEDALLDALPWEYACGPDGFLVCETPFVRGIARQRVPPPVLNEPLHIVAIPSNPLKKDLPPLNIDGEWMRLQETIGQLSYQVTLERTRPPTILQLRSLVANQHQRVVHFMGHGGQDAKVGAYLCFEEDNGKLAPVTARQFVQRVRGTVFLVTLNACVSATPGETPFSNLAAALVQQKVPYALGMRLSIADDDARAFSRTFYGDLAQGVPVEDALLQARLTLAESKRPWAVGVPVLYTSLTDAAPGFPCLAGTPTIEEHQPHLDVQLALPRAQGIFQGRLDELQQLGTLLTGDLRPPIVTIHGNGGQGKTALAREAVERFAYAWPGGVYATTLEHLPERELFVADLARFLGLQLSQEAAATEQERQVLARLSQQRTLIVLDNAETLVEAVQANNAAAIRLTQFLRDGLAGARACLLVTSRVFLEWVGEVALDNDLPGLAAEEGAQLFGQSTPQRLHELDMALAAELSRKVDGHPLSLRLLGGAFNQSTMSLAAFLAECERHLLAAENKYVGVDHRHRTLYACIETSVRSLDADLTHLFSQLWLFHAPFLPSTAVSIFDAEHDDEAGTPSPVEEQLYRLWQRGLLTRETVSLREGTLLYYRVLPTVRPYIEHYLADRDTQEPLLRQFAVACASVVDFLYQQLDRSSMAAFLALLQRDDLERAIAYQSEETAGWYVLRWGWVQQRLGYRKRGLALTEQALELAQGQDRTLMLQAWNNMALVYSATGNPKRALDLYEQALPLMREVGDRAGEASTLNNMAGVYSATGNPKRALDLYEQALPLRREVGDRAGEAATLNGLAYLFIAMQRYPNALTAFEQSIALAQAVDYPAAEVAGLVSLALLLYQHLGRPVEAMQRLEQALAVMQQIGLSHDAAGRTPEKIQAYLDAMRQGSASTSATDAVQTMPTEQLQTIIANSITVMTALPERHHEWRQTIAGARDDARQRGASWQIEVDFYSAVLDLLDGQTASLPDTHPYRHALDTIQAGVLAGGSQTEEDEHSHEQEQEPLPFDAELIPRSIVALLGSPQEKLAHAQYLSTLSTQTTDDALKELLQALQVALFGADHSALGQNLTGVYRQAWEAILLGVEAEGIDPAIFETLVHNTLAVLGPVADKKDAWRATLGQFKEQAQAAGAEQFVQLVESILQLIDAHGKPAGLDTPLKGIYARTWQQIITRLPSS